EGREPNALALLHMVQERRCQAPLARHLLPRTRIRIDKSLQGLLNGTVSQRIACRIRIITQQAVACALVEQCVQVRSSGRRSKAKSNEIAPRQEIIHHELPTRWHKGTGFQHLAKQGRRRWMTLANHFDELAHQGCRVSLHKAGEIVSVESLTRSSRTGRSQEKLARRSDDVSCGCQRLRPGSLQPPRQAADRLI